MVPSETSDFDPDVVTPQSLRNQPISVVKTELPALAKALGVEPAELFRSLTGPQVEGVEGLRSRSPIAECCTNDSW